MRSGFVSFIGRPNVGKSSLLNSILGKRIAITSDKPQTTRNMIQGIYNDKDTQIVFVDTPGIHKPKSKLGRVLNKQAYFTINDVDIVIMVVDISEKIGTGDKFVIDVLKNIKDKPVFLVINKIDKLPREEILKKIDEYQKLYDFAEIIPVSARKNDNTDRLLEVIKKYCSPTGGGIQTLFMQIYMAKTLDLSNQLLGMLFNGEYQLMEFVINESEFRIPFVGNGLPVDDISSGSSSQIAIMGMIINLVLLHQASTKFNIARLDEIDGPLDTNNRLGFVNTLYNLIQMLGIEQLFLISHSIEADTSSVDIIKFKYNEELESNILGNVIYDYKEEYEKTLK